MGMTLALIFAPSRRLVARAIVEVLVCNRVESTTVAFHSQEGGL